MPCNSEYLNPTAREREIKRAATLIVFALEGLGKKVPHDIKRRASDIYGADSIRFRKDDSVINLLCKTVTNMSDADRERIVYNAHDKTSRDLAEWWETHQEADRKRIAREEAAAAERAARATAKAKLTPAERRAVGLN